MLLRQTFTKAENYPRALQAGFTVRKRLRCPSARSPTPYAGRDRSRGTRRTSQTCFRNPSGFKICALPRRGPPLGLSPRPPRPAPHRADRRSPPAVRAGDSHRSPSKSGRKRGCKKRVGLSPCWGEGTFLRRHHTSAGRGKTTCPRITERENTAQLGHPRSHLPHCWQPAYY